MLVGISGELVILYVSVIFGLMVLIGTIMNKILPGKSMPLMIDLPPMRLPKLMNILHKVRIRSFHFLKEASPWFFLGAFIIGVLQVTGGLVLWQKLWGPITEFWLKLPKEAANAFIMGMIRRDFGAAGLTKLSLDPFQTIVSLVVITLFVPCIASFMILLKERGIKEGLIIWFGALSMAFLIGGILAQVVMPLIS
jgi:ferrous iron transport protein B